MSIRYPYLPPHSCPLPGLFPLSPGLFPSPQCVLQSSHSLAKLPPADTITIATIQAGFLFLSLTVSTCSLTTIPQLPSCWRLSPLCHQIYFHCGGQGPHTMVGLPLLSRQIPVLHTCDPLHCFLGYPRTVSPGSPNIFDLSCLDLHRILFLCLPQKPCHLWVLCQMPSPSEP